MQFSSNSSALNIHIESRLFPVPYFSVRSMQCYNYAYFKRRLFCFQMMCATWGEYHNYCEIETKEVQLGGSFATPSHPDACPISRFVTLHKVVLINTHVPRDPYSIFIKVISQGSKPDDTLARAKFGLPSGDLLSSRDS